MKSTYNMIISILEGVTCFIFLILGIIFHPNPFEILFYVFLGLGMILSFLFQAIYFSKEESTSKTVCYRLSNVFSSVSIKILIIYYLMKYPFSSKWVLMGFLLLFLIFEILIDSFDKPKEIRYLLSSFQLFVLLFLLFYSFQNIILLLSIFAVCLYFISKLLGNILENKYLLSFPFISLLIIGIITIFFKNMI